MDNAKWSVQYERYSTGDGITLISCKEKRDEAISDCSSRLDASGWYFVRAVSMEHTYSIMIGGKLFENQTPELGAWYCAIEMRDDDDGEEYASGGIIAQYVGDGQFYDEDSDRDYGIEMRGADYLSFQNHGTIA